MYSKKFSVRLLFLIFIIFLLNYFAMEFHWYSSIWYFDMIMHFLGGFWVSFAFIYFFPIKDNNKYIKYLLKTFFVVLFIGIGWEIFEILIDKNITGDSVNILDTLSDIFFDMSGGLFASFYFFRKVIFIRGNEL